MLTTRGGLVPVAVAELVNEKPLAYPDGSWNQANGKPVSKHFVSVQSVYIDRIGRQLWVVDDANPQMQGLVAGGAKLVQIDLTTNRVVRIIRFGADATLPGSYFNDIRIDRSRQVAYVSDLGLGAIVVVDLTTGQTRRVLTGHASTKSENITMSVNGTP